MTGRPPGPSPRTPAAGSPTPRPPTSGGPAHSRTAADTLMRPPMGAATWRPTPLAALCRPPLAERQCGRAGPAAPAWAITVSACAHAAPSRREESAAQAAPVLCSYAGDAQARRELACNHARLPARGARWARGPQGELRPSRPAADCAGQHACSPARLPLHLLPLLPGPEPSSGTCR